MLLRENQQYITPTGIEECRLIISIIALVVHKVPVEDQKSSSGFGAFHLAILSVAARFFDAEAWTEYVSEEDLRIGEVGCRRS
jgi:nuclear pore complex protein Nup205